MVGVWSWVLSWIISVLLISLVAGVIDEATYRKIETNQKFGFFLVFVLPTLIESFSYYIAKAPVFYGLV